MSVSCSQLSSHHLAAAASTGGRPDGIVCGAIEVELLGSPEGSGFAVCRCRGGGTSHPACWCTSRSKRGDSSLRPFFVLLWCWANGYLLCLSRQSALT
jgi:hypothetical protein